MGGSTALLEVESWTVRELESSARPSEVFWFFFVLFLNTHLLIWLCQIFLSWGTLDLGSLAVAHELFAMACGI